MPVDRYVHLIVLIREARQPSSSQGATQPSGTKLMYPPNNLT